MKAKLLLYLAIVFFLIVNSSYYWEPRVGIWFLPIAMLLTGLFFTLVLFCLYQILKGYRESFTNSTRNWSIGTTVVLLGLICLKPQGIVDFDQMEGEDLFVAQREGTANCRTVFQLKAGGKFKETTYCFGVDRTWGNYQIRNDTIFFTEVTSISRKGEYFGFGTIQKSEGDKDIEFVRHYSLRDSTGPELWITKNELEL